MSTYKLGETHNIDFQYLIEGDLDDFSNASLGFELKDVNGIIYHTGYGTIKTKVVTVSGNVLIECEAEVFMSLDLPESETYLLVSSLEDNEGDVHTNTISLKVEQPIEYGESDDTALVELVGSDLTLVFSHPELAQDVPDVFIDDTSTLVGSLLTFNVRLSKVSTVNIDVNWSLVIRETGAVSAEVATILIGQTNTDISFATAAHIDPTTVQDLHYDVSITGVSEGNVIKSSAIGKIIDTDTINVSVSDVTFLNTSNSVTFTLTSDKVATFPLNIKYETIDGTLKYSQGDYIKGTGISTIGVGNTSQVVTIPFLSSLNYLQAKDNDNVIQLKIEALDSNLVNITDSLGTAIIDVVGTETAYRSTLLNRHNKVIGSYASTGAATTNAAFFAVNTLNANVSPFSAIKMNLNIAPERREGRTIRVVPASATSDYTGPNDFNAKFLFSTADYTTSDTPSKSIEFGIERIAGVLTWVVYVDDGGGSFSPALAWRQNTTPTLSTTQPFDLSFIKSDGTYQAIDITHPTPNTLKTFPLDSIVLVLTIGGMSLGFEIFNVGASDAQNEFWLNNSQYNLYFDYTLDSTIASTIKYSTLISS